jgi:uncharacterized LabA/DUF88 family protein
MKVLVDYDNLPLDASSKGLIYLADRILTRISSVADPKQAIDFRLYGGWDRNNQMTRTGQDLSVEIRSAFPRTLKVAEVPVILKMQLAQALEALPGKRLPNTLRAEPMRKIKCQTPSKVACRNASCPIDPMASFLNAGRCPVEGCIAEPNMLLSRSEQKLVDTMIVADMIYLASQGESCIGLVSSDDDMWPGILSALNLGVGVIHLQTRILNISPVYLTSTRGAYTPIGL